MGRSAETMWRDSLSAPKRITRAAITERRRMNKIESTYANIAASIHGRLIDAVMANPKRTTALIMAAGAVAWKLISLAGNAAIDF